jgi:hypothetical protein
MKKAVFWDVAPCRYGVNRRFGGRCRLHLHGRREIIRKSAREASVRDVRGFILATYFTHVTRGEAPAENHTTTPHNITVLLLKNTRMT